MKFPETKMRNGMQSIQMTTLRPLLGLIIVILQLSTAQAVAEGKKTAKKETPAAMGTEAPVAPMDEAIILVDGNPITHRDVMGYMQAHPDVIARAADSEEGKAEAYRELVRAFLLERAMYAEGLLPKGGQPTQQAVIEAYEKLAEKHFPLPPTPDDKEGFAYYQAHQELYGIPPVFRVNEILIKVPAQADKAVEEAALQRAKAALERINKGQKFTEVALEVSENPIGKVTRGDIGFVNPKEDRWIGDALSKLKVGEHTDILKSPKGFVILELSDTRPGLISPYANVRDQVIKTVRDQKQKVLRDPYVKELAKHAKIEIVLPALKPLYPHGIFGE